ncbi:MAG TPA: hypothetical protein IAA26_11100 [Candidatus Blautia faecipullorum]|nr:hypothetical protein [Candidatus Blautia faecipullorum]
MLERWIVKHWLALCIGCLGMGAALRVTYHLRGYLAVGGEWMIIPMVFLIEKAIREIKDGK